ncbi:MAG TPA: DICT sensory domain-containing protein [Crinalium sp.]
MLEGSILQKLRDAHQAGQTGKRLLNFGVYYKNTLVALCHALEDSILTADYSPLVITAFQRGKWYLQEADRYGELAERSRHIIIMAAPDAGFTEHPTSQRSNVDIIGLDPFDPVAQEWHLIIVSPNYTAMVLCQELSEEDYGPGGVPKEDQERKFYGLWTFEPNLVEETAALAIAHVGLYNPTLEAQLAAQLKEIEDRAHDRTALCGTPTVDNLGQIVSRVVDYLQTHQQDLAQGLHTYSMPGQRSIDSNLLSNELQAFLRISQLIDQTDLSNPMAAAEVAALAETLGQLLDLPAWQLHRLRLAGLLHRMAFISKPETELSPGTTPRYEDSSVPLACPLVPGTQILRTMSRMKAIATIITHQTEWWNGSGQPAGLAGDEIPVESRILGLASYFQQSLASLRTGPSRDGDFTSDSSEALATALAACQADQDERWDPKLIETLSLLVNGLQQGLSLPVTIPKIAAGLWMLDSHSNDELLRFDSAADSVGFSVEQSTYGH